MFALGRRVGRGLNDAPGVRMTGLLRGGCDGRVEAPVCVSLCMCTGAGGCIACERRSVDW